MTWIRFGFLNTSWPQAKRALLKWHCFVSSGSLGASARGCLLYAYILLLMYLVVNGALVDCLLWRQGLKKSKLTVEKFYRLVEEISMCVYGHNRGSWIMGTCVNRSAPAWLFVYSSSTLQVLSLRGLPYNHDITSPMHSILNQEWQKVTLVFRYDLMIETKYGIAFSGPDRETQIFAGLMWSQQCLTH